MEDSTYVRVNRARVKKGHWDEFEAAYSSIVPMVGKAEGLHGRWLVRSLEDTDACDLPPRTIPRLNLDLFPLEGRTDTAVAHM
jgi:hypothetical protein